MLEYYSKKFSSLRTDRSEARWSEDLCGRAPHKPLLLLSIMDLIEKGAIQSNFIEPNPLLGNQFSSYWSRIMPPEKRGSLVYPFFHMKSEGFWHLVPLTGQSKALAATREVRSLAQLSELALGASLDQPLFDLLQSADACNTLRNVLLSVYFSQTFRDVLLGQIDINSKAYDYSKYLLQEVSVGEEKASYNSPPKVSEAARSQGFKRVVISAYQYRCASCGLRMVTSEGHIAVQAAHIIPWSISKDDDPRNGIALCRLCHWAFDEGLLAISKKYKVLLAREMMSLDNLPGHLTTLHSRDMIRPVNELCMPRLDSIGWHLEHKFRTHM